MADPTVPETTPPGLMDGTPPSGTFQRGVLSGNATTREREPRDSSVAPQRASVAETQAHGVSSSPADAPPSQAFASEEVPHVWHDFTDWDGLPCLCAHCGISHWEAGVVLREDGSIGQPQP